MPKDATGLSLCRTLRKAAPTMSTRFIMVALIQTGANGSSRSMRFTLRKNQCSPFKRKCPPFNHVGSSTMKLIIPLLLVSSLLAPAKERKSELKPAEQAELIKLYEEEIVAHDLYVALGKIHPGIRPFQNIPHSEIQHRDALAALMKDLKVRRPKAPKGQRYASDGLDQLYKELLAKGRKSEAAACKVGVGFEELDIAELRAAQTSIPAAKDTLLQLEAASGNHLRAFHRNLTARGGKYKATHLPKSDLKAILAGEGPTGTAGCGACAGCGGGCKKAEDGKRASGRTGEGTGRGQGRGRRRGRGHGHRAGRGPN